MSIKKMYNENLQNKNIFYNNSDFTEENLQNYINTNLKSCHEGELFLEYTQNEVIELENGIIRNANLSIDQGFGLRGVVDDVVAYVYSDVFDFKSLDNANKTINSILNSNKISHNVDLTQNKKNKFYTDINPIEDMDFKSKLEKLLEIDKYIRSKDTNVKQVFITMINNYQIIEIIQPDLVPVRDIRPLVRLSISIIMEKNNIIERGSSSFGGRYGNEKILDKNFWQHHADEAIRRANVNLEARPCKAGLMPVVLGNGWTGVLLHEAVGHGLEGDFNRKKSSVYTDMIGKKIAASGVTVIDNGTIENRRGSLNIDDEGTPTQENILIEDGILKKYMQDRMNARLMNVKPTGNGRRESYRYAPMPRMTNTYMLDGKHDKEEMIKSVENGIYAVNFSGGQVDITSGQFVFAASEAYKIENGKVTYPVKGATIIGSGAEVMQNISMIGNDSKLDEGSGTCGKSGQSVPVGVGQPSLLISSITVGGTSIDG